MTALVIGLILCVMVYGIALLKNSGDRPLKKKPEPPMDHPLDVSEIFYHSDWETHWTKQN
jgi:hypothetical protein